MSAFLKTAEDVEKEKNLGTKAPRSEHMQNFLITLIVACIIGGTYAWFEYLEPYFFDPYEKALKLSKLSDKEKAYRAFTSVIQRDPKNIDAYYQRALLYLDVKPVQVHFEGFWFVHYKANYDQEVLNSFGDLNKVLQLNPKHFEANLYSAQKFASTMTTDQAIKFYNHALENAPADNKVKSQIYAENGVVHLLSYEQPKLKAASLELLNKAISLDQDNALAYHYRAIFYHTKGDIDRALADLEKSVNLKPSEIVHYHYAVALKGQEQWQKAAQQFTQAIHLSGGNNSIPNIPMSGMLPVTLTSPQMKYLRGRLQCYYQLDDYTKTFYDAEELVRLEDNKEENYMFLLAAAAELKEYQKLYSYAANAIRKCEEDNLLFEEVMKVMKTTKELNHKDFAFHALRHGSYETQKLALEEFKSFAETLSESEVKHIRQYCLSDGNFDIVLGGFSIILKAPVSEAVVNMALEPFFENLSEPVQKVAIKVLLREDVTIKANSGLHENLRRAWKISSKTAKFQLVSVFERNNLDMPEVMVFLEKSYQNMHPETKKLAEGCLEEIVKAGHKEWKAKAELILK